MTTQTFTSPAKLNLMLHITRRRDDGYHNIQTMFQFIALCDDISIQLSRRHRIKRCFGNENIPEQDDLLIKAANLLQQHAKKKFGVNIGIDKKIPSGGGLGGGSSNAATVLLALNKMLDLNIAKGDLASLARQLGADVPVFIFGQSAWGEGIGEQLEAVKLAKKHFLLLHPQVFISTRQLFSASELTRDCSPITIRAFLAGEGKNVFQPLVLKHYPEVKKAHDWLSQFATSKLSGTGACLFAAFENEQQAIDIQKQVPNCWNSWVVKGLNKSPLLQQVK